MGVRLRKPILNIAQLFSGDICSKILSMAVLVFYTRYLTKTELSLLPIYEMLGGMSALFFGFGLLPTFVRSLPVLFKKDVAKAQSIILTGSSIILVGSALYSIGVFFFSEDISGLVLHDNAYSGLFKIMAIGCFVIGLKKVTYHLMWSDARFGLISLLNIFQSIMNASVTVGLLLLLGIKGLVLGLVFSDTVYVCISIFSLKNIVFGPNHKFYPAKKLLKKSFPFYLESYLMYFRSQGDNWIVTTFLGPASLAIYYIAKKIYGILLMMLESTDKVITSNFSSNKDNIANFRKYLTQALTGISYAVFPIVFFVIGISPSAIFILAGSSYMDAVLPAIILCLATLVLFVRMPIGRAVFVLMSPRYRFKITAVESFCLVLSLFLFTPVFKESGVALSRLFSSIIAGMYAYFLLSDVVTMRLPLKKVVILLIPPASMAGCLLLFQFINFKLIMMPLYILCGVVLFLVLTSFSNSSMFYNTLNDFSPFRIVDPIKWILNFLRKPG